MARRKRKGRRRKNKSFNKAATFAEFTHLSYMNEVIRDEEKKEKQSEYLKKIAMIEEELLSRTVFVTNVKDLKLPENVTKLKLFMELYYGPVEICCKSSFEGRKRNQKFPSHSFPPGRVRFRRREDANKIFNKELKDAKAEMIPCLQVGFRGSIRVQPAKRYADMADQELKGQQLSFSVDSMSLGHWVPSFDDVYDKWSESTAKTKTEEWVEDTKVNLDGHNLNMTIDLALRQFSISVDKPIDQVQSNPNSDDFDFLLKLMFELQPPLQDVVNFRFKDLANYIEFCRDQQNNLFLLFSLKQPPKRFQGFCDAYDDIVLKRCVKFANIDATTFGRCLGIKLAIKEVVASRVLLHEELKRLQDFGIFRNSFNSLQETLLFRSVSSSNSYLDTLDALLEKVHGNNAEIGLLLKGLLSSGLCSSYHMIKDTIEVNREYQALPSMLQMPKFRTCHEKTAAIMTLERMLYTAGSTRFPCKLFHELKKGLEEKGDSSIPDYCVRIPRLLLTPSHGKIVGFGTEMSNRVVRKFTSDYGFKLTSFLRVQVGDENGQRLYRDDLTRDVEEYLKNALLSGLKINGRHYYFFAFSSSQLKECALWMIDLEDRWTVKRMREILGDFSKCRTASKFAARIGQCFSTTVESTKAGSNVVSNVSLLHAVIDDIKAEDKVHSDGTGIISKQLRSQLLSHIPFAPLDEKDVSIIQVRYGGAKGTLTFWDLDEVRKHRRLSAPVGNNIFIRPSMIKFETKYTNIEVCSVGSTIPYYLNRNVILLLVFLGVRDRTFIDMQQEMLIDFDKMLTSHSVAVRVLPKLSGPDSTIRNTLLHMLQCGLSPLSEPFLFSCVHSIRSHHLIGLQKKGRILIEEGAVLMGGLDETGLVPEGCVFLQISERFDDPQINKRLHKIIRGAVLVTKHPVMHPGDARMLLAVDIPVLRTHRNIILFSQHGLRPEADKMSGSDLDGDEFAVTWDKRLLLKEWNNCSESFRLNATVESLQRANFPPMSYTAPPTDSIPSLPSDDQERSKKLLDFFFDHVKSDNLGQIAMLWQDWSAKYNAGCPECITLAELHSIAVDFPKSGVPAVIPDEVRKLPFQRAHWREIKNDRMSRFDDESVIGKLYNEVVKRVDDTFYSRIKSLAGRKIDKHGLVLTTLDWGKRLDDIYDVRIPERLGLPSRGADRLIERASQNRALFEEEILTVMKKYHVRSEGELFTGCIRKYHKLHKKRQHDIAEEVRRQCRMIQSNHRYHFFSTVLSLEESEQYNGENNFNDDNNDNDGNTIDSNNEDDYNESDSDSVYSFSEELVSQAEACATGTHRHQLSPRGCAIREISFQLAAAYYVVTYFVSYRNHKKPALFSFPWIVADVISAGLREEADNRKH